MQLVKAGVYGDTGKLIGKYWEEEHEEKPIMAYLLNDTVTNM